MARKVDKNFVGGTQIVQVFRSKLESSWRRIVRFDGKSGIAPLKNVGNDMYRIF
jgi:hypothetical protein